jgi:hypothetical protein
MTAASPGPGPNIFSILSRENDGLYRTRREPFVFSLLGQAAIFSAAGLFHELRHSRHTRNRATTS